MDQSLSGNNEKIRTRLRKRALTAHQILLMTKISASNLLETAKG
ncbi:hypothetical protein TERTU_1737 [Teredinibacter turnerae T7901]|uniref:Uncharacterized protein n=1 Tax=Teredinibacter turnerae (strain ATCC 39867 / T7901) TaxID=377629 RepID=C5BU74_TERTT|nr:hypothetical protein TERTU_1737 [Teredinibacter turnerae T7901]